MSLPRSERPWLDVSASIDDRVALLLEQMTLAELVGQLHQTANLTPHEDADLVAAGAVGSTLLASGATAGNVRDEGVTRARIDELQAAAMETSRLGIPLLIARDVIHGHRTVFPIPLGLAASFDESLLFDASERAALEASADGITWTFAPMVDLVDDPRWGRVAESLGESALATSRLGAAMVAGFQASGHVTACAKHYVGYGLSRGGRDYGSADVGDITLRNHHLRPFKTAVEAGVGTVMAAFSDVDGVPMHSHHHLLREVLKEEWGFDGVVVADWDGVGELVAHGVAGDLREAARLAIEAGVDVDMVSGAYHAHLASLVEEGTVRRDLVRDAARRVLRLKFRLGLFDADCPTLPGGGHREGSAALGIDRPLADRAAAASFVVLKDEGVLPLTLPVAPELPLLLTGAFSHEQLGLLGTWVLDGDPSAVSTIAPALRAALGAQTGSPHEDRLLVDTGAFPDRTLRLAREAGTTIALVGEHPNRSGEDGSTSSIALPPGQTEFLQALSQVAERLVVVVFAGRALALEPVLSCADVVILAWHPGIEGGPALASVLAGTRRAGGVLPLSLPRSAGHLPITHAERPSGRPIADSPRGAGRYIDSPTDPVRRFGSGSSVLSYGELQVAQAEVAREDGIVELWLSVTNPSECEVREPVLLMMRDEVAEVTRPVRELVDFTVAILPARGIEEIRFTLPVAAFGYHGRDRSFRVDAGRIVLTVGWGREDASQVTINLV